MGQWTLDTFRTRVQKAVGEPGLSNDELDDYINQGYEEVIGAVDLHFPELYASHTFVTVDEQSTYDLPTDLSEISAVVDQENDRRLARLDLDDYYAKNPDTDNTGEPTHWARDASCIYLWPTPDTDDESFRILYIQNITHLSDVDDKTAIAPRYDQAIYLFAVANALMALSDKRAQSFFQRAVFHLGSRKKPRDEEKTSNAAGLNVAHSLEDLTDQET